MDDPRLMQVLAASDQTKRDAEHAKAIRYRRMMAPAPPLLKLELNWITAADREYRSRLKAWAELYSRAGWQSVEPPAIRSLAIDAKRQAVVALGCLDTAQIRRLIARCTEGPDRDVLNTFATYTLADADWRRVFSVLGQAQRLREAVARLEAIDRQITASRPRAPKSVTLPSRAMQIPHAAQQFADTELSHE